MAANSAPQVCSVDVDAPQHTVGEASGIGPSSSTEAMIRRLKEPLHVHCGRANLAVADKLDKCPFLAENPVVRRSAARESNARTYVRKFPMALASATGGHDRTVGCSLLWLRLHCNGY